MFCIHCGKGRYKHKSSGECEDMPGKEFSLVSASKLNFADIAHFYVKDIARHTKGKIQIWEIGFTNGIKTNSTASTPEGPTGLPNNFPSAICEDYRRGFKEGLYFAKFKLEHHDLRNKELEVRPISPARTTDRHLQLMP
jgi:hypothetical protein